jgi:hypothetical protein
MVEQEKAGKELAKGAGRMAIHVFAIIAGLVLMFVGVAMGVTVVMLPAGVPVGFFGLFVFLWGLFGKAEETKNAVLR